MKKAVILFNLGGPDKMENVEPFLFNLFNDPAILNLPSLFRYPLAKFIANRRAPIAKKIYQELGGSSPILKLTKDQSSALEIKLNSDDSSCSLYVLYVYVYTVNFRYVQWLVYSEEHIQTVGSSFSLICICNNLKTKIDF